MNCDEFADRLQSCLDHREDPAIDPLVRRHAGSCDACCQRLEVWQQIDLVMTPGSGTSGNGLPDQSQLRIQRITTRGRLSAPGKQAALAASLILILCSGFWIGVRRHQRELVQVTVDRSTAVERPQQPSAFGDQDRLVASDNDAAIWLETMRHRDWLDETMPAVRSVRDGVAPLGRSLLQAVTLLTSGGATQTS